MFAIAKPMRTCLAIAAMGALPFVAATPASANDRPDQRQAQFERAAREDAPRPFAMRAQPAETMRQRPEMAAPARAVARPAANFAVQRAPVVAGRAEWSGPQQQQQRFVERGRDGWHRPDENRYAENHRPGWNDGDQRGWRDRDRQNWYRDYDAVRQYRIGRYDEPEGYAYRRYEYGQYLPNIYWSSDYYLPAYWQFGLDIPPAGYAWVRYGPDAVMIDLYNGQIAEVVYDLFD